MKFFKSKPWSIDATLYSEDTIKKMELKYIEEDLLYSKYFEKIKEKLPKNFLKIYFENIGFHDYILSNINIENLKYNKINIHIELNSDYCSLEGERFLLSYKDVDNYSIDVPQDKKLYFGYMQWLSNEYYFHQNGLWTDRIMCDGNCELIITFKKISIRKI